jgi:hypothetical protein
MLSELFAWLLIPKGIIPTSINETDMTQNINQEIESLKIEIEALRVIYTRINQYALETYGSSILEIESSLEFKERLLSSIDNEEDWFND